MAGSRIVLSGLGAQVQGLRWESDTRLRLGRSTALEVVINDASVSREHAELAATPQGWLLRDLGSRNGTRLNNTRLDREALVQTGDLILAGQVLLQVTEAEPAPHSLSEGPPVEIRASGARFNLKAATRRTWERAVEQLSQHDEQRSWPSRRMLPLLRAGHHLSQMTSLDDMLRTMLDEIVSVLAAQRGAIVLADEETGRLQLRAVVTSEDRLKTRKAFSATLADRCYLEGESILCADVSAEEDLAGVPSVAQGAMSSIICALLRSPRRRLGVLHLDRGPFQEPFTRDDFDLVDAIACYMSVGIESAQMLQQQRDLFVRAATTLAQTVELRDDYTGNHTNRVTAYALMLAEELGLSAAERQQLAIGTPLHDIGKIAVADAVLRKPDALTAGERVEMQAHVTKGEALLGNLPGLLPMLPIVRHHHEHWDGSGYPDHLAGEAIPLLARVVAVADAFDAMTSDRPYRKALSLETALAELVASAGSHFDPRCVEAFLRLQPRIEVLLASTGLRSSMAAAAAACAPVA